MDTQSKYVKTNRSEDKMKSLQIITDVSYQSFIGSEMIVCGKCQGHITYSPTIQQHASDNNFIDHVNETGQGSNYTYIQEVYDGFNCEGMEEILDEAQRIIMSLALIIALNHVCVNHACLLYIKTVHLFILHFI